MNNWDEFRECFNAGKQTIAQADSVAGQMAKMIEGRLRKANVSLSTLVKLKKELRDFNMHTKEWKTP